MRRVLLLVLLAACGSKSKPAPESVANTGPAEHGEPASVQNTVDPRIPACGEYVVLVQRYVACPTLTQETRDGLELALDAMRAGWGDPSKYDDETLRAINDACLQGDDALRQSANGMGCKI